VPDPIPFATPADWHTWLAANQSETEVWVLYHKKASGTPSIDWSQAVVEALCWGWIDGVRKTLNETQWIQSFTPRKPGSAWSQINIAHAERLIALGRMQPRGQAAIDTAKARGDWDRSYSGGKDAALPQDFLVALTTAKRPVTRAKRMADFVAKLARGEPIL